MAGKTSKKATKPLPKPDPAQSKVSGRKRDQPTDVELESTREAPPAKRLRKPSEKKAEMDARMKAPPEDVDDTSERAASETEEVSTEDSDGETPDDGEGAGTEDVNVRQFAKGVLHSLTEPHRMIMSRFMSRPSLYSRARVPVILS